jgi:mitochondrial fission protein ELM1
MKRKSKRFIRFHEEFKIMNITRDFNTLDKLENWTYTKLEESKRIAGIIKKRIIERKNES